MGKVIIVLLGIVSIAIVFFLFAFIFSPKSFVKYSLYCKKMWNLYNALIRHGASNTEALEKISKVRHPELSDVVHKKLISKFPGVEELIHFIYWGIEVTLMTEPERTDKNALAVIEAGNVVLVGKYYKVTVDKEKVKNILYEESRNNAGGPKLEKKKQKARGLVYALLEIMGKISETLMEEVAYVELPQDKKDEIWMECLLFTLHQFNRTFFVWLGREQRDELMDEVLITLNNYLKTVIEDGVKKAHESLSADTFDQYADMTGFQNYLKDFHYIYDEREKEYSQYNDNPKEGEGLAGTLLWEFGNKVARMMNRENDLAIIMKMQFIGTAFTHFTDPIKELIETGKIGDTDFKLDGEE